MKNHVLLMFIYALLTALFFTLLWKEPPARKRFFIIVFCSLFLGGLVAGWVMYPFPLK